MANQWETRLNRHNFEALGQQLRERIEAGREYRLRLEPYREKRTLSQNATAHMWYAEISRYLVARGRADCTPEFMKRALKATFLGFEEETYLEVITGERTKRQVLRKTSRLKTGEMFDFMTRVQAWALEIGCVVTAPIDSEFMQNRLKQDQ